MGDSDCERRGTGTGRVLRNRQTPKGYYAENGVGDIPAETSSRPVGSRRSCRITALKANDSTPVKLNGSGGGGHQRSPDTNSNAENEEFGRRRNENENTPRSSKLSLSRNRNRSASRSQQKSFVFEPSINEETQRVTAIIRTTLTTPTHASTPTRRRSVRQSVIGVSKKIYNDSSSDEEACGSDSNFVPNTKVSEEEETSDEDDETLGEDSTDESNSHDEDESDNEVTPTKKPLLTSDLSRLAVTPDILRKVEGRSIRRKLTVDSPVATSSQTMSPNPEAYFLAENRIKYRKKVVSQVMNDAMKGKRKLSRRKLIHGNVETLPEKIQSNFSVTTEAAKATVEEKDYVPGNMHEEEVELLLKNTIENEFPYWLRLFRDGFNVMLYGVGSKLSVLRKFEIYVNENYLVVSVNGLFPKLNARKLLYGICEHVNPHMRIPHGSNLETVARDISELLKTDVKPDVFIMVNNFDTLALRMPQLLSVLCWLSQVPFIHVLASCDTVNAFLGVTQSQALQLQFCWMHCPTYLQYREELKWFPGIFGDERKAITQKSSLKYVLQSLTGNARKAFSLLGQMQLKQMKSFTEEKSKETYMGVRFQELAKECREKFIAHSDENLRTLLVEFFDHKLIKQSGKGRHLENLLMVELDKETLEEVISEL